jgi:hypothetical protein
MTMEERILIFQQALQAMERLESNYPGFPPFLSIQNQLAFLLGQVTGQPKDRDKLESINLGYISMREVEQRDDAAADLLYLASAEAKKMLYEP